VYREVCVLGYKFSFVKIILCSSFDMPARFANVSQFFTAADTSDMIMSDSADERPNVCALTFKAAIARSFSTSEKTLVTRTAVESGFGLTSKTGDSLHPLPERSSPWLRRWSSVLFRSI